MAAFNRLGRTSDGIVRRILWAGAATACLVSALARADVTPLINEIDADTPGRDMAEFVELSDGGVGNTALDGYVLVFYNGSNDQSYAAFDLSGAVTSPDGFYVLGNNGVNGVVTTFAGNTLQNGQDAVALYRGHASDFPNGTPVTTDQLVDAVVYGTGDADDPGLAPLLIDGAMQLDEDARGDKDHQSLQRMPDAAGGARDTRAFAVAAPTPGAINGSGDGNDTGGDMPDDAVTGLHTFDVQGASQTSPYAGRPVAGVPGVITAIRSNGVTIQDPVGDDNVATSDALVVFTGGMPRALDGSALSVGDVVRVAGTVSEYVPGGNSSGNLPTTEIDTQDNGSVQHVANPGALFAGRQVVPTLIGRNGRRPPTQIIDNDTQGKVTDANDTTYDPDQDGIDFFESLESMVVSVDDAQVVGPTNRFGEFYVVGDAGSQASGINRRGGITLVDRDAGVDYNPERIQIDGDGLGPQGGPVQVDVGARLAHIEGVFDYAFGHYRIRPAALTVSQPSTLERTVGPALVGGTTLSLANFNVENLDPNDSDGDQDIADGKFDRLAALIVNNLRAPDILALQEVQDNDGSADTGVVAADKTLAMLVDAIQAAGGPAYQYSEIVPGNKTDGGQPGGNIRNAFLYNPARVQLVAGTEGAGDTGTATQPVAGADGQLALTLSPGRIAPTDTAFDHSRKPLAAVFAFQGQHVLVINNHLTSKGGSSPLYGNTQPPVNGGEAARTAQARLIHAFIEQAQAVVDQPRIATLGDFNEFAFLKPLQVLTGADDGAAILTDVLNRLPAVERYTYVFQGNSQALDHLFVTDNLYAVARVGVRHIDAEFADQASDHDPIVAEFDLSADAVPDQPRDNGSHHDGSGGCTIGNGHDASLPLLAAIAAFVLGWRHCRRAR